MRCQNTRACPVAREQIELPSSFRACPDCGESLRASRFAVVKRVALVVFSICLLGVGLRYGMRKAIADRNNPQPLVTAPAPKPPKPAVQPKNIDPVIEQIVGSVPFVKGVTISELASKLTRRGTSGEIRDPEMMARIFYRWLAEHIPYDAVAAQSDRLSSPDPDTTLAAGKAVCSGYSAVFTALCQDCGLEAANVGGHARTSQSIIGKPIDPNDRGHMWNAVKINGDWRLLDATWGAGHVSGSTFNKSYRPSYLFVPPEIFIYTHLPDDQKWQLLPNPIDQTAFVNQPIAGPDFFQIASITTPTSAKSGPIRANSAQDILVLDVQSGYKLSAELLAAGAGRKKIPGLSERSTNGEFRISLASSAVKSGRYRIRIFGAPQSANRLSWLGDFPLEWQSSSTTSSTVAPGDPPEFYATYYDEKAELIEPSVRDLVAGARQKFRIRVPGAISVQIQVGNSPVWLPRKNGAFETTMVVPRGPFKLFAKLNSTDNVIHALAEFDGK